MINREGISIVNLCTRPAAQKLLLLEEEGQVGIHLMSRLLSQVNFPELATKTQSRLGTILLIQAKEIQMGESS